MSFRKREEILTSNSVPRTNVAPGNVPRREMPPGHHPRRGPAAINIGPTRRDVPLRSNANVDSLQRNMMGMHLHPRSHSNSGHNDSQNTLSASHPGVRPSPATSQPTTSTGCFDLDKLMGHTGFPLGNSLLIEEESATDFNSVLAKAFAAQGIVHNRVEGPQGSKSGNTHLVVLSLNHQLAKELPGLYKGSRKDIKKSKIREEQSKVTVSNLSEYQPKHSNSKQRSNDLKIAWRYGINDENAKPENSHENELSETYPEYNHQFDITTTMIPAPTSNEISFISPLLPVSSVLSQLNATIKRHDSKLIRILIPNLLHPALYPPEMTQLSEIMPLLHGIRSLVKQHKSRCVLLSTMSTTLFHRQPLFLTLIEQLFDGVVNLEPFGQDMLQLLEKAYRSQPNKIQHGLVHIKKLPVFSERGEMHVARSEWAFKNGRKRFEIEEWGIPVEDDDSENKNDHPTHKNKPDSSADPEQSHLKQLEF